MEVSDQEEEEEEEVEDGLGTSILSAIRLNKTKSETCDYLDGFFNDDQEQLVPRSLLPHSLVSATDSGDDDQEEIEDYLKSLKTRAGKSRRMGGSSTQDRHTELWTLPVPVLFFPLYSWLGN